MAGLKMNVHPIAKQRYSTGFRLLIMHIVLLFLPLLGNIQKYSLLLLIPIAYSGLIVLCLVDYRRRPDIYIALAASVVENSLFFAFYRIMPVVVLSLLCKGAYLITDFPVLGLLGDLGFGFSILGLIYCCGFGISYWGIPHRHKDQ